MPLDDRELSQELDDLAPLLDEEDWPELEDESPEELTLCLELEDDRPDDDEDWPLDDRLDVNDDDEDCPLELKELTRLDKLLNCADDEDKSLDEELAPLLEDELAPLEDELAALEETDDELDLLLEDELFCALDDDSRLED